MDFRLPELGEGVYEAEMTRWLVKAGDRVAPGHGLLEVLTDKATMEVPSPFAGVVQELSAEPGDILKIGEVVLKYDTFDDGNGQPVETPSTSAENGKKTEADVKTETKPASNASTAVKAAPAVRQLARERGIDLASIVGSGPEGRILIGDLPAPASGTPKSAVKPGPAAATSTSESIGDFGKPGTRIKLQGLRRKIAEHMVISSRTIPTFSYVDECDVSDLVRTRSGLKDVYARQGVKLTYLAFFVRAVARSLREVPIVNSSLDDQTEEIILHNVYHVGVAVATPGGLIVPVIRDADKKSLLDIARELQRLGDDARAGKSRLDDLRGGTFTITSIGGIGGLFASPIIHQPQVGILGVGKVVQRPIFDARGQVVPADMAYLSFSFDHRVLDGAAAIVFGNAVIRHLQRPLELAMDG